MSKSYIAKYIDEEYRREQAFKKAKRQPCKTKKCSECKFIEICTEKNNSFLNEIIESFIDEMGKKKE